MLYVTPQDPLNIYTAYRGLTMDRGADGGLLVPYRLPLFSEPELHALAVCSPGDCMARILNHFFRTSLTAAQVEFAIGRKPIRSHMLDRRTIVGELWHVPYGSFSWMADKLSRMMGGPKPATEWTCVAVRIAALFALYGRLVAKGSIREGEGLDISLICGDLSGLMSAWYARQMGLPLGNVICCCNENHSLWELLHQGTMETNGVAAETILTKQNVSVPQGLERLCHACGGTGESLRFLEAMRRGDAYKPTAIALARMRQGIRPAVVGSHRVLETIRGVYASYGYVMEPYTALCYTGLVDDRAQGGERRMGLILSEESPVHNDALTAEALGLSLQEFHICIDQL